MRMARIVRRKDGSTLIASCGIAETPLERMRGLLAHAALPEDQGLWFPGGTSFHTFFMRFPIDVAFLGRGGRVIALYHATKPWRHSWIHPFAAGGGMLEASAGLFERVGLAKGEELEICPSS